MKKELKEKRQDEEFPEEVIAFKRTKEYKKLLKLLKELPILEDIGYSCSLDFEFDGGNLLMGRTVSKYEKINSIDLHYFISGAYEEIIFAKK